MLTERPPRPRRLSNALRQRYAPVVEAVRQAGGRSVPTAVVYTHLSYGFGGGDDPRSYTGRQRVARLTRVLKEMARYDLIDGEWDGRRFVWSLPAAEERKDRRTWAAERCRDAWAVLRTVPAGQGEDALVRHGRDSTRDGLSDDMLEIAGLIEERC